MDSTDLHNLCLRWVAWRNTRRFYVKPCSVNVLARMQPSKSGQEPDARLDGKMQHFNSAVSALMGEAARADDMRCFWSFYVVQDKQIDAVAKKMGIARRTYYERVKRAARAAYRLSREIDECQASMPSAADMQVID